MIEELRPCPYCSEIKNLNKDAFVVSPRIECLNCRALGPWADTRAGAIEAWNQRKKIWDFVLHREKEVSSMNKPTKEEMLKLIDKKTEDLVERFDAEELKTWRAIRRLVESMGMGFVENSLLQAGVRVKREK